MSTATKPVVHVTPRLTPLYKVIAHNDDVTTMEFVVKVLLEIFKKSEQEAIQLMMDIHNTGLGIVDVLPLELAELRVDQTHSMARARGFPLTLTIEPADA